MSEHDERNSAGDFVIDAEIDNAIGALQSMKTDVASCSVHAASTVLILRISKQLLKGQLTQASSVAALRSVAKDQEGRLTKVEARAFEAEPISAGGIVQNFTRQSAKQTNPLAWVAIMVVSALATLWKWKGWA